MKVLFDHQIFTYQHSGGISRYIAYLHHHLAQAGVQSRIATRYSSTIYLNGEFPPLTSHDENRGKHRRQARRNEKYSLQQIRRADYDILHPSYSNPYLLEASRGRKLVLTLHDPGYDVSRIDFDWHRQMIRRADKVITISDFIRGQIMHYFPDTPAEKIEVVHHGVMLAGELPPACKPVVEGDYLLFTGLRTTYKNFEYFLREALPVAARYGMKIVCTAGGEFTRQEHDWIAGYGGAHIVEQMTVDDSQLRWLYCNTACFVFPSLYEGFGLPVLEAFDAGCPLILANATCFPEVAGDAAMYFEPQRQGALTHALEQVLDNQILRLSITTKGSERIKEFSPEKMVERTAAVYRSLL